LEKVRGDTLEDNISAYDLEKISQLSKQLKVYAKNIAHAREALRKFLAKSFSIEDLLFYQ
jgi:hypothetical protein